ncbi:MAG: hypothetical protein MJD61_11175 [Proteobacteria bacterium]|nr:hypothetical protein [Pseudomonadota bacterium]
MPDSILTSAEQTLLRELIARGVRFMVVGMSAALMQGARGATEDIDLWFENVTDSRIGEAVKAAGGIWVSGSFGMGPPRIGGEELSERFDVVVHMSGLERFATEFQHVRYETVDGIDIPIIPLNRVLVSKRAANRTKDRAQLAAIEDALLLLEAAGERT